MAKCPKCSNIIPPYGFPFNGNWMSIICHKCKSKLSIRVKDFYKWYLLPFLMLFSVGLLLLKYSSINPIALGGITTFLSFYFYSTVGWEHTRLETI
jgi:hypothetical protein